MTNKQARSSARGEGRVYGGLDPEQRKAMRREQFLEAGLAVFGGEGFRSATVRKLCREAKLTDRYFYESFANLQELLTAVYELHMGRIRERIYSSVMTCSAAEPPRTQVRLMLNAYFSALEDPRVARVCMVELEGISPDVEQLYHGYILSFSELIVELASHVYPHWQLPDDESLMLGMALVGAMRQTATHWLRSGYTMPRETVVRAALRLVMGVIDSIEADQGAAGAQCPLA